jgi:acyl-CoA reductase-like NAD-dependent aldehyde dehydrogenase
MDMKVALEGLGHLVDGEVIRSSETFDVTDPAIGEVFAQCPAADAALVDRAVTAAFAAGPRWAANEPRRREVLGQMLDILETNLADIEALSLRERGTAFGESYAALMWGRHVVATPLPVEIVEDSPKRQVRVIRRPIGVVAAIAPWNAPILMIVDKIVTALVAGNTVVAKPSPFTSLATLHLADLWRDVVPPGVLNVLAGNDEVGKAMVAHPDVRMISFTGSVAAGKHIAAEAAAGLKNVLLELGGNDAAIVLDDADPAEIAQGLYAGAFSNTGQICSAIKRLYVPEPLYDGVVAELAAIARDAKLGQSSDGATMGPLSTRPQYERVCELVDDALESGAKAVTGGAPLDQAGFFYPPTILTSVAPGMRIVDEEQFGPVLPVLAYTDLDATLDEVNAGAYGLGGSVWTRDVTRGAEVAARLESGSSWVNKHPDVGPHVPFGGVKSSGIGRSWGRAGIDAYCELKSVFAPKPPASS